mmetsp:Transcript_20652/g.15196  ORF Transcript_20652/g.15196 Transcript_20652/m.15196 type:complete len:85 (+) Transcript_20652:215-469(+)|eukprot:CAMPEP_0202980630 /NCGR_PEP_ID=MMETSP1396-20130829/86515_1 /ASSEMBLY_ACC=CAM_ASM_000872 /TAXON_ID= /ORGANISM="Pseudokeronopsis sp., Strain Brazil" /LENGTH=84 /DNA_ID=CAMNT_0049720723 /DNA_START=138 /DNA_END=392 /DNA_ORIENTATION=+
MEDVATIDELKGIKNGEAREFSGEVVEDQAEAERRARVASQNEETWKFVQDAVSNNSYNFLFEMEGKDHEDYIYILNNRNDLET